MKLNDVKHNHSLTDLLKILIFSILMMIPFIDVGIRCAYVVCNKNAYQSYSGTANATYVNPTELTSGNEYELYKPLNQSFNLDADIYADFEEIRSSNASITNYWITHQQQINRIKFVAVNTENSRIEFYENTTYLDYWTVSASTSLYINFVVNDTSTMSNNIYFRQYNVVLDTLDNVFEYSVNKLKNDQLFNWTQQTGVYTGVNAMTTGLGLTDGTISILITYWTLLSIIYVIIDIVLEGFVALTHMILKKAS